METPCEVRQGSFLSRLEKRPGVCGFRLAVTPDVSPGPRSAPAGVAIESGCFRSQSLRRSAVGWTIELHGALLAVWRAVSAASVTGTTVVVFAAVLLGDRTGAAASAIAAHGVRIGDSAIVPLPRTLSCKTFVSVLFAGFRFHTHFTPHGKCRKCSSALSSHWPLSDGSVSVALVVRRLMTAETVKS
jgi:hypothetical protein